jgi:predicted DNA-binding transcriptional regulator YafY
MSFLNQLERLKRIEKLIQLQATGSPKQFARKLGISESTLYEDLNILKEMGGDIAYSRSLLSYCFKTKAKLQIGFSHSELLQINGGQAIFSSLRKYPSELSYTCSAFK